MWLLRLITSLSIIVLVSVINSGCAEQSTSGPFQIALTSQGGGHGISSSIDKTISKAISDLVHTLGNPLPAIELNEYKGINQTSPDGLTLNAVYAEPIDLRSTSGLLLANAKLVCIQWDRSDNKPNRLFYGKESKGLFEGKVEFVQVIDGGFQIIGDIAALNEAVSSLVVMERPGPRAKTVLKYQSTLMYEWKGILNQRHKVSIY